MKYNRYHIIYVIYYIIESIIIKQPLENNMTDLNDKPLYRPMPAAFFGPDETSDYADVIIKSPKYRSLGCMQPAFYNEFSKAPKYRSSFTQYCNNSNQSNKDLSKNNQNIDNAHEPVWKSMGAFSDLPTNNYCNYSNNFHNLSKFL